MARRQPPAPKERPTVLAASGAPRTVAPPPLGHPARGPRKSDDVGAIVFIVLVTLGLIAATRAFLLLGA